MSIETPTKPGLISKALILLGEKPLVSLTDDRYGATVGSNLFEMLYENELQAHPWRFSMKKGALSQLNLEPLNEWQFVHQLPSDMLLLRHVYPRTSYDVYGDRVYSNRTTIEIDYQFKPEVADIPAYFATLMTYALARDMCSPITESKSGVEVFRAKYREQLNRAQYADAQARPAKPIQDNPFIDVRGGR